MTPQEEAYNAEFAERLRFSRDAMGMSRSALGRALGVTSEQVKRFETRTEDRPHASFPVYLLPALIKATLEPYEYWIGARPSRYEHIMAVKSR